LIEIYDPFTGYFEEKEVDLGDMNEAISRKFNFVIILQRKERKNKKHWSKKKKQFKVILKENSSLF
jgi:hypothetical protein